MKEINMNNEKMTNLVEKAQKGDKNALNELANIYITTY